MQFCSERKSEKESSELTGSEGSDNRKTSPPPPIKDDGSLDYDGKFIF